MARFLASLARICGALATLSLWIAGVGMIVMTALIGAQVFFRYVLNNPLVWSEQTSVVLMGWFIFLGTAVGVREGYHLGFEVLRYVLPASADRWLTSISDLAVLAFGAGMVWYGIQLAAKTWSTALPVVHLPTGVTYVPLSVSGALVVLFSLERLLRRAAGLEAAEKPQTAEEIIASETS